MHLVFSVSSDLKNVNCCVQYFCSPAAWYSCNRELFIDLIRYILCIHFLADIEQNKSTDTVKYNHNQSDQSALFQTITLC